MEYVEAHEDEIRAWYAAQAESADAQEAYLAHLEERGDLDDGELDGDDEPPSSGVLEYIQPPEDDPVLSQLHITARYDRSTPLGDAYELRVSHPDGGSVTYEVTEHRHGGWHLRRTSKGQRPPTKVRTAVVNWVESGALGRALDTAVPF